MELQLAGFDGDDRRGLRGVAVFVEGGDTAGAGEVFGGGDGVAEFRALGDAGAFDGVDENVEGVVAEGGIGVGAAHGKGHVYKQGSYVGDTSMTQVTVGFQLGGQAYSQVIFFEDKRAFDEFTSGNFEFSAQATAVAITAAVSAEANTGGGMSAGASGGKNDASTASHGYRKGMAIFTVAKGGQSLGIGAGQMNRVGSARLALEAAGERAQGAVLASDGFFPFDDTVRLAAGQGITAVIQPGGSVRDADSITACNALGLAMVVTGRRHFLH